ncbi:ABC transporter ATP-binding protein [Neotabrizicola sp. VNH66]|uniref:ABC transporter ATP-binding protein n=1 Tax=Neotabrizicola sp. VNH66 TaxID=3400918 RepID=UPI003C09D321
MAEVRVERLHRSFGQFTAVGDLSFTIADGEFVFFLGPSGCGKTTTLRMIAGLLMPTSGRIELGGRNVTFLKPRYRNVGMVFQSNVLYHHLSVYENLAYPLKVRGWSAADIRRKVHEVAELLQITGVLHRGTEGLSGGQAQRVAIGRMLVRDADVFLMDEPISHLDAKLRAHMRAELRHLQKELGRTTLFVSHDQLEAMSMADRIAVMNGGELLQLAPPQEVFDRPANAFVAGFVGEPQMNILEVTLDDGQLQAAGFTATAPSGWLAQHRIAPGPMRLGIRPEHVETAPAPLPGGFAARLEAMEPMGAENLMTFDLGGQPFKVRQTTGQSDDFAPGDTVHLRPRPDHLYLFDLASGRTLAQAAFTDRSRA